MINTRFTINIKTNTKDNTIDFIYKRKDLTPLENNQEKAFIIFAEQLIRGVLDKGFAQGTGDNNGESVEK